MKAPKRHWRSIEDLREGPAAPAEPDGSFRHSREFPGGDPSEIEVSEVDRRSFLGLMGASTALAGITLTPGCVRKPVENILPYNERPEDLVPGQPRYFRTAWNIGRDVLGLHVASLDGRPTKVEGNPDHPMSFGAASAWAQASVLDLYDPMRATTPKFGENDATWELAAETIGKELAGFVGAGTGLAILMDGKPSPTRRRLLGELTRVFPKLSLYEHDPAVNTAQKAGLGFVGAAGRKVLYDMSAAAIVVALDADVVGFEGDSVRNARQLTTGRQVHGPTDTMNRLYAAEPVFSVTGMMADNRLRVPSSHVGELLRAIAEKVIGSDVPTTIRAEVMGRKDRAPGGLAWSTRFAAFVDAVVADLKAFPGQSVIAVGERQPAWVHGLAALVNDQLGNTGKTVFYPVDPGAPPVGNLAALTADIQAQRVSMLVILGGNPVYTAAADVPFGDALKTVPVSIHHGLYRDETGALTTWQLPASHYLEAWGDLVATDGTVSIQQPLIAPLYASRSDIELLLLLLRQPEPNALAEVRKTLLPAQGEAADRAWRRGLHDGVLKAAKLPIDTPRWDWRGLAQPMRDYKGPFKPSPGALEFDFVRDPSLLDGRYATNAWLQELPDPLSKLTWDNAALMSAKTASAAGVAHGEIAQLTLGGRSLEIAVAVVPGTADYCVVLPLGYGRELGPVALEGKGFHVESIRPAAAPFVAQNGQMKATGKTYELASTQTHGTMVEPITGVKRPIVREATLGEFQARPEFVKQYEIMDEANLKSLWVPPNPTDGQQWAMTIDLNTCTGCNACTIACQSENNIPVVGKERVMDGREMHWIRLDRYFVGDDDNPEAVVQPMACAQCEMAPCENVCPVAATTHSPEGLNDMAYNRCIGTRYCSNNCPFKVRRFNFFNYNKENRATSPMWGMQKNPNVTVRFRGVMEKCTYCVQRITMAKIAAKRDGDGVVPDGAIVPACVQTCPTQAIVFGDKNTEGALVAQRRASPRNYAVLAELNIHPRTTYLAKLRNPNMALVNDGSRG